jgi:predicted permease
VVGRSVLLDGTSTTVIGVMPEGFYFPSPDYRAWLPLNLDPADGFYQGNGWLVLTGRLKPGVTPERLQDDLNGLATQLGDRFTYPEAWDKTRNPYSRPLRSYLLGDVRPAVLLLLGAVGVLLLMACANVAALILTRTSDRTGEMSVRAALGAGRTRLARQMITESVVLGLAGGAIGLLLAFGLFDMLVAALPLEQGFGETLSMDWTTIVVALLLSVGAGALVSLAPLRNLLKGGVFAGSLRERTQSGVGARAGRMQGALVVAEVLLAVVLVTGAALLVRSVDRLQGIDPGLDAGDVLAMDLYIGAEETTEEERLIFFREVIRQVNALPGVENAGLINRLPVRDGGYQGPITIEDRPDLSGTLRPNTAYRVITPQTFAALDIKVIEGRGIEETDRLGMPPVVVVNEVFASEMWPGQSALGRRIGATMSLRSNELFEVVGVIRNVAVHNLVSPAPRAAYYSWEQVPMATGAILLIESDGDATSLAGTARDVIAQADRRAAVGRVETMRQVVDAGMAENLRLRLFLTLFSLLGLVLGTVGVYGVASYAVERRRAEFGVRMALGAAPSHLLTAVIRIGMIPVVVGVAAGAAVSFALSGVIERFLYEVAPTDPLALGAAAGALLLAGIVAALVPAFRASRTDPAKALRAE